MQKAYSLDQSEMQYVTKAQDDHKTAMARYGELSLEMEAIKKQLEVLAERQRDFVRVSLMHHGVDQYTSARVNGNNVEYVTEDAPQEVLPPPAKSLKTNGAADRV